MSEILKNLSMSDGNGGELESGQLDENFLVKLKNTTEKHKERQPKALKDAEKDREEDELLSIAFPEVTKVNTC